MVYKGLFSELCTKYPAHEKIFTNGSKSENGVAASAVQFTHCTKESCKCIQADGQAYQHKLADQQKLMERLINTS